MGQVEEASWVGSHASGDQDLRSLEKCSVVKPRLAFSTLLSKESLFLPNEIRSLDRRPGKKAMSLSRG